MRMPRRVFNRKGVRLEGLRLLMPKRKLKRLSRMLNLSFRIWISIIRSERPKICSKMPKIRQKVLIQIKPIKNFRNSSLKWVVLPKVRSTNSKKLKERPKKKQINRRESSRAPHLISHTLDISNS